MAENQPTWRYSMNLEKGLICLEPKEQDENLDYTHDFNYQQGFVAFPEQVAFSTTDEIWKCHFVVEMSSTPPSLDGAVQAVCAPLNVETEDGVYIRDLMNPEETSYRLDIPPGEYDVLVRFYPEVDLPDDLDEAEEFAAVEAAAAAAVNATAENDDDDDEDEEDEEDEEDDLFNPQCKVGITFLPRGTIGPKVLLVSFGDIPDQIVLHRNDGSSYTVPSGGEKS